MNTQKPKRVSFVSIEETMNYCERYRRQLIFYCLQYFDCEYQIAEDCVQDAFVALFENLKNGKEISNYKAWLYSVVLNYKNQVIKDKSKRNELNFPDNQSKEDVLENGSFYNPDYVNRMVTYKMIEDQALRIVSQLNPKDKELYILYYRKHKKLKDIAIELNVNYSTIRKRHELLKKKVHKKIIESEP